MIRSFISIAAVATVAVMPAAALASTYAATPVTVAPASRIIAADISWRCGPAACLGSTVESRPIVLCQDLAKRTGRLTSFLVDGRAFVPTELDQCNTKARGNAPLARAN